MSFPKQLIKRILGNTLWQLMIRCWLMLVRIHVLILGSIGRLALHGLSTPEAVKIIEKLRFYAPLDYSKGNVQFRISTYGEYKRATRACAKEPGTVAWIERHFQSGDIFFDIGANVGAYSFVAHAFTNGQCRAYAFEPSFSTFAALCNNVYANNCIESIVPLQIALSDCTGLATFKYSNIAPGAAFHSVGNSADDVDPVLVVGWDREVLAQRGLSGISLDKGVMFNPVLAQPTITCRLEDAIGIFGLPIPNHIKIDVDGAEFKVIDGASAIFASPALRSLLIELDLDSVERMKLLMDGLGFVATESFPCGIDYASIVFERLGGELSETKGLVSNG